MRKRKYNCPLCSRASLEKAFTEIIQSIIHVYNTLSSYTYYQQILDLNANSKIKIYEKDIIIHKNTK